MELVVPAFEIAQLGPELGSIAVAPPQVGLCNEANPRELLFVVFSRLSLGPATAQQVGGVTKVGGTSRRTTGASRAGQPLRMLAWAATLAALVATMLAGLSSATALQLLGLPDPGALTSFGLPAATAAGEVAAVVAVGSLLLAAFLVPPQRSGILDVDGYVAVRTACTAAIVWALCAVAMVPLSISSSSGLPVAEVLSNPAELPRVIGELEGTSAWAWTAVIALILAVFCRNTLRHSWTPMLLTIALLGLMPRAVSGHSSAGGGHDVATDSLILHVVAAALWAGGLAALLMHARRGGSHLDVAANRFSVVALAGFATMAVSGLLNAMVRVPVVAVLSSTYGALVLTKLVLLAGLGVIGWRQRRVAILRLTRDPTDRSTFVRFAIIESTVFAVAIGVAVALSRTPPPADSDPELTALEAVLGYALDGPPTLARLVMQWRFDLLAGSAAILFAALYLWAVHTLRRRGEKWPGFRTAIWVSGCAVLLLVSSSGVGRYAPALFSVHLASQSVLALVVPLFWVLGAPLTLAASWLRPSTADAAPGLREWLVAAAVGPVARFLTHPAITVIMLLGSLFGVYFSGVYEAVAGSHVAHVVMIWLVLAAGSAFYWVVLGADSIPRRWSRRTRIATAITAFVGYVSLGIAVMESERVFGATFFESLPLDWRGDLAADQRLGGWVALLVGVPSLLFAMVTAGARRGSGQR